VTQAAIRIVDDDEIVLRKSGVRFPVELRPVGFVPDDLSTWPDAVGRLEYVEGRLLYMPPCADVQQEVAVDVVHVLSSWMQGHPEFVVGANEAGMKLGTDIRAADAAIWRRADVGPSTGRLRHAPPLLAVEIGGVDDDEPAMRDKARWYLQHGVKVVWVVLPDTREVLVLGKDAESRHARGQHLPQIAEIPDLSPDVGSFFLQVDRSEL